MKIDFKDNSITYREQNAFQRQHKPLSTSFSEIEVLGDGRILVIEDYFKFDYQGKSNLYCLNKILEIDWFVPLPNPDVGDDIYVGFTSIGERVFANTWTGFRAEVNIETGEVKNVEFFK